jgi:hypothetical protein
MNNKQLIKQITKDLKLCSEWTEKNKIIMEEYKNRNFKDDGRCACDVCLCDRCERCGVCFNQSEEVLWNDDISPMWEYHQEIGNDDGDLCADCILKLNYCVGKCLECKELFDINKRTNELTSEERDLYWKLVDDGIDNGDFCVQCLLKDNKQLG